MNGPPCRHDPPESPVGADWSWTAGWCYLCWLGLNTAEYGELYYGRTPADPRLIPTDPAPDRAPPGDRRPGVRRVLRCSYYVDGPKVRIHGSARDYRECRSARSPRYGLPVCPCDQSTNCNPRCPGFEPTEEDDE